MRQHPRTDRAVRRPRRNASRRTALLAALPDRPGRPSSLWSRPGRRALVRRAVALGLALGVAWVVGDELGAARAERTGWGTSARVAVTTRPVGSGDELGPGSVELRDLPVALVPPSALRSIPSGRRTAGAVAEGEVLVAERLRPEGTGRIGSTVGDRDRVAIAVPLGPTATPVEPGDLVDVVAPDTTATTAEDAGPVTLAGHTVAERATVLQVDDGTATLGVHRSDGSAVADAALGGLVVLVVVG